MDNMNTDPSLEDFLKSIPEVTDEEQKEIDELHGEPEGYKPFYSREIEI